MTKKITFSQPIVWRHPETELPGKRILAIAPHPDDETISFGGTLALHAKRGDIIKVIICTDGRNGDPYGKYDPHVYISLREQECKRAMSILGVFDVEFWREQDGELFHSESFVPKLIECFRQFQPDTIYFPSPFEFHSDHLAVTEGVISALKKSSVQPDLLMGEIMEFLIANLLVVVDSTYERKKNALKCYSSQLNYVDIDVMNEGINHTRTANFVQDKNHVEAFIYTNKRDVRKIVNKIYSLRKRLLE
jgi:LmbE family N-acetylglucosaminyl deacetylase